MKFDPKKQIPTYIKGGIIIDPSHGLNREGELLIENGIITHIGTPKELSDLAKKKSAEIIDVKGAIVCPGFIDLNARMGEPEEDPAESFSLNSLAAVEGGFTSVACMSTEGCFNDNALMTDYILRQAQEKSKVRVFPIGALTQKSEGEKLSEMGSMTKAGIIAVGDDGRAVMDSYIMRKALEYAKAFSLPVFSFPQDKNLVGKGVIDEGVQSCKLGLRGIPAAAEEVMVARDIVLAKYTESKLHFSSISTKGAVHAIREAKAEGISITAETNPHYFSLTSSDVVSFDAAFKYFPPLRSEEHVNALISGLADGTIDAIASRHTPQSISSKDMVFEHASADGPSFSSALFRSLQLVRKKHISLEKMITLFTLGPAKILGLDQMGLGMLKVSGPADILVFRPDQTNAKNIVTHVWVNGVVVKVKGKE